MASKNPLCVFRFTCASEVCSRGDEITSMPECYTGSLEKPCWYEQDWREVNSITWREVFSLEELWVYLLLLIVIGVFLFYVFTLLRILGSGC